MTGRHPHQCAYHRRDHELRVSHYYPSLEPTLVKSVMGPTVTQKRDAALWQGFHVSGVPLQTDYSGTCTHLAAS